LESEISSNVIFVDLAPPQKTSEGGSEDSTKENSEIISQSREKLINYLQENSATYQPNDNFKTNFEKLLSTSTNPKKNPKKDTGEKTAKGPKLKPIDLRTTI